MNSFSILNRLAAPACLALLAACQTVPSKTDMSASPSPEAAETTAPAPVAPSSAAPQTTTEAEEQGLPVAVLLADTEAHEGWVSVTLNEGTQLYLNPEPVLTREDLTGVQAGSSSAGDGLLALELSPAAAARITAITTDNPNKRLALIVGRTMMAAPGYTAPVTTEQLVFAIGTEENAMAAARAIAGVSEDGTPAGNAPPQ